MDDFAEIELTLGHLREGGPPVVVVEVLAPDGSSAGRAAVPAEAFFRTVEQLARAGGFFNRPADLPPRRGSSPD